jgi:hypothetical protein
MISSPEYTTVFQILYSGDTQSILEIPRLPQATTPGWSVVGGMVLITDFYDVVVGNRLCSVSVSRLVHVGVGEFRPEGAPKGPA